MCAHISTKPGCSRPMASCSKQRSPPDPARPRPSRATGVQKKRAFRGNTMKSAVFHLIAAARPNFMKVAPLYHALAKQDWCKPVLVHTGQHYDFNMSDAFFRD